MGGRGGRALIGLAFRAASMLHGALDHATLPRPLWCAVLSSWADLPASYQGQCLSGLSARPQRRGGGRLVALIRIEPRPHRGKHLAKHLLGEAARIGVVP